MLASLVAASAWPLATYTCTLACFGLAHVIYELRYVDLRFTHRLGRRLRWGLGVGIGGIAVERIAVASALLPSQKGRVVELALGLGLVLCTAPAVLRGGLVRACLGLCIVTALGCAILFDPVRGLLCVAIAHNFTPAMFILEAMPSPRPRVVVGLVGVFVLLPLFILAGGMYEIVDTLGWLRPEFSPLSAGHLESNMRAYLPSNSMARSWALHAFSACVFLQCVHYIAVINVLPRLQDNPSKGLLAWPKARPWMLVVLGGATYVAFAQDFSGSRSWYGVAAAIHAWLELPLLLLALVRRPAP